MLQLLRTYSSAIDEPLTEWNKVKSSYSEKELETVFNTLNKCDSNQMKRYW